MTVRLSTTGTIELHGACPLEDAQELHQCLLADPQATVDWRGCDFAHTAVIQILLAARSTMLGPPRSDFLRNMVEPLLKPLQHDDDKNVHHGKIPEPARGRSAEQTKRNNR